MFVWLQYKKSTIDKNDITCNDEIFLNAINEKPSNITMNDLIYDFERVQIIMQYSKLNNLSKIMQQSQANMN